MAQLITSDQFITGVLCELVLNGTTEIRLKETVADERFERAYRDLLAHQDELEVEPDFSLLTSPDHGDSETLRETLYGIRERGLVAINNPSFKTVEIKLDERRALNYLSRSPLSRAYLGKIIELYFADDSEPDRAGSR